MTLAELKARIEAEALRRQAAREGFTLDAVKAYLGQPSALPPEVLPPPPVPPERLTYAWFASLDGRQFVNSCYTVVLGRSPDASGLEHYVEQLRHGADKAFILGAVVYSAEGRRRGRRVAGLLPRFAVAAAKRVPLAGVFVAWLEAIAFAHVREREHKAFEQRAQARIDAIAEYVGHSGAQVAMRIEALRSVLESRD